MSVKAKQTITMQVEVTVDLGEIELTEYDDYPRYLHNKDTLAVHTARVKSDLRDYIVADSEDITASFGRSHLDVQILPESEALFNSWVQAEEDESDRLFEEVGKIADSLGITEAIWSFSQEGDRGDYRQGLIDNPLFREGRVKFIYEVDGYWDGGEDRTVETHVFEDPHYKDVFVAADLLLRQQGDKHHVFVEGAIDKGVDENGVQVYALYYGS